MIPCRMQRAGMKRGRKSFVKNSFVVSFTKFLEIFCLTCDAAKVFMITETRAYFAMPSIELFLVEFHSNLIFTELVFGCQYLLISGFCFFDNFFNLSSISAVCWNSSSFCDSTRQKNRDGLMKCVIWICSPSGNIFKLLKFN